MLKIKNILFTVVATLSSISIAATIDLDGAGTIEEYSTTINKLEFYNDTTSEWVMLSDTAKTVNIASVTAGNAVGSMIKKGLTLKFGTYTKLKATVSGTFTLDACYDTSSTCTTGSKLSTIAGHAGNDHASIASNSVANRAATIVLVDFSNCGGCLSGAPSGESRAAVSGGVAITYTLPTAFVMNAATTSMTADIKFNIDDKLTYVADDDDGHKYITPAFPLVNLTVQ